MSTAEQVDRARTSLWNTDLPRGVVRTKAGHLRYTSPKELRGKYVHRHRVELQISEMPYSIRLLLPWPYEVHHMDYNKENNGDGNLLLLSEALHAALTAHGQKGTDGRFESKFRPKWLPPPEWALFKEDDDGIPF